MITDQNALRDTVTRAASRLVSVRSLGEAMSVSLPIAYPSGTFAAVNVSISKDVCFVSDCALGLQEAEMATAGDFFEASANEAANWFGVGFDGASVFAAFAPIDRIEGAMFAVANASARAVSQALIRASEAKDKAVNSAVFDIVVSVFGRPNVAKTMELNGREALWTPHNVVSVNGGKAVFEFVSPHPNSIAGKYLMFSDLSKADHPPALVSVVKSIDGLGRKGAMLGDVSNVIQLSAEATTYRQYAKAA
jgi:hypothetical protein